MAAKTQLKKEIWRWFKKMQVIYLATTHGKKPQVRPVTMVHFKKKAWVLTGTKDAKIRQIRKNSSVQYCLLIKRGKFTGYIRADCRARIVKDARTRKLLAEKTPFFKRFWKTYADPMFTLLELSVKRIEYLKPGKFLSETILF